jgi:dTDP-4-amino-4,6-dideoxygalactose transaminase
MIPFLDLRAQYAALQPELEAAVLETMRSGAFALGPAVERFEERFAAYCGADQAIAVNTGTSALHLALLAAGIGAGDEVITVSATFVATTAAILYAGATPVFVDIDDTTWTMDPSKIEAAITPRTKAVMPVHLHGRLADMAAINAVARAHGLVVIEDACQAHGAERDGKRAGTWGDIAAFSFYPGKNLGACGEGGGITTDNAEYAEIMRSLRDWGQAGKYNHVRHGFNYRMDGVQGAALGVKLGHLDAWNAARRRIANAYDKGLDRGLVRAAGPFGADHSCHVYAIRTHDRATMRARLQNDGVSTLMHYPTPVHLQPAYADLGFAEGSLPVTEALARETLSLPLYPEMADADVERVIAAVNTIVADSRAAA